jgi:RecG-like helicase
MLMDMLGIFIGFSAIMLLFSLLVTALVHGAQAALNLRLKNLKNVIEAFFNQIDFIESDLVKNIVEKIDLRSPKQLYATALPLNLQGNQLKLTSIGQQELIDIINSTHELSIEQRDQLTQKIHYYFEALEELMSQRFKQWMHQISIATAFVLCFVFQLNCFSILKDLNQDSYYRSQLGLVAKQLTVKSVLKSDSKNNPELLQHHIQALNFEITPKQWKPYYTTFNTQSLTNWIGIIFSAILISLGAPFWFNRLKDMISLRDRLSEQKR